MDFWHKARSFAEEAAKRSQDITIGSSKLSDIVSETAKRSKEIAAEASKRSQEITIGSSKLSDIVSETAKRSKEIAAEASKRADQIKSEAVKRADQIKSLAEGMAPSRAEKEMELERFGVTEELREFVKEITMSTFQDFPLEGIALHHFPFSFLLFASVFCVSAWFLRKCRKWKEIGTLSIRCNREFCLSTFCVLLHLSLLI